MTENSIYQPSVPSRHRRARSWSAICPHDQLLGFTCCHLSSGGNGWLSSDSEPYRRGYVFNARCTAIDIVIRHKCFPRRAWTWSTRFRTSPERVVNLNAAIARRFYLRASTTIFIILLHARSPIVLYTCGTHNNITIYYVYSRYADGIYVCLERITRRRMRKDLYIFIYTIGKAWS